MADSGKNSDQEWEELLSELRILLPGVQVLFAFLLIIPFQNRFDQIAGEDRTVFFIAFLCTAVAAALLTAPSVYHRLLWRQHDKQHVLKVSNRLAIASSPFLATAIASVVFLITQLLYGDRWGVLAVGGIGGLIAVLWYGLPLGRRADQ